MLSESNSVDPSIRLRVTKEIYHTADDIKVSREIEAAIHASSSSHEMYKDKSLQILHNLKMRPNLLEAGANIVCMTDVEMSQDTIIANIENETQLRRARFDSMLQNKYDQMSDAAYRSTMKCRRCGSEDVQVEQKQTRGADEAMTVFCSCSRCSNRWTMR